MVEWAAYISKAENAARFGLWYNGEVRGWTTWQLHNTQFKFGEVDERADTDETDEIDDQDGEIIIDDDGSNNSTNNTDGTIIDWSNTTSDYFYEKIHADADGLRLRNAYEVKDHWQIEQSLSLESGELYAWFTNSIIYTGDYFANRFSFDGDVLIEYGLTANTDVADITTYAEKEFEGPTGAYLVTSWLDTS